MVLFFRKLCFLSISHALIATTIFHWFLQDFMKFVWIITHIGIVCSSKMSWPVYLFGHNITSTQLFWQVKSLLEFPMADMCCVKFSCILVKPFSFFISVSNVKTEYFRKWLFLRQNELPDKKFITRKVINGY